MPCRSEFWTRGYGNWKTHGTGRTLKKEAKQKPANMIIDRSCSSGLAVCC